jgi:orotidine-5'-phosphate decarboxylase
LENGRGLFLLAATSNPEAFMFQSAVAGGDSVAKIVYEFANEYSEGEIGSIGVVIGATVETAKLGINLAQRSNVPVLVPGFGAQGVELAKAGSLMQTHSSASIFSVSRSVAGMSKDGLPTRIALAKSELEVGLRA